MWKTWQREQQGAANRQHFNQISIFEDYNLSSVLHYEDKASVYNHTSYV